MWHPVSLLILWAGFVATLQFAPFGMLAGLVVLAILLAGIFAAERSHRLLWRSRWLFLSLGILFLFFTPGEYLPAYAGKIGLTFEGLERTGEHLGRLLAMLLSLALLHEWLGTTGLMAGLYWLMRPLPWGAVTVVRLMLVLEIVENKHQAGWRDWLIADPSPAETMPDQLGLSMPSFHLRDQVLIASLLVIGLVLVAWS